MKQSSVYNRAKEIAAAIRHQERLQKNFGLNILGRMADIKIVGLHQPLQHQ